MKPEAYVRLHPERALGIPGAKLALRGVNECGCVIYSRRVLEEFNSVSLLETVIELTKKWKYPPTFVK